MIKFKGKINKIALQLAIYFHNKYLIVTNPPINSTVKAIASQLKYLSINSLITGPNFQISAATRKKRAPLLIIEAITNIIILILNAPEEIVINLQGSGVNPAVNIIQKSYSM